MWDWLDHPFLPYMQIKVLLFRACNGFVVIKQSSQFKVYGLLGTVCSRHTYCVTGEHWFRQCGGQ